MRVTAVVVSHDGSAYLPRTLAALQGQTRPADRLIGVDAGSSDNSVQLLSGSLGTENTISTEARGGFGAAVRAALAGATARDRTANPAAETEFLWFLHDDSAPAPEALAELLHAVERAPSVTIAGCKQVDWDDSRSLIDVGLSTSRWGERLTMIELDEQDQGQYDARSDVFAVNSAGMLVRRDVWEELAGFDPALPGLGDDVDLCLRNRLAGHRVVVVPGAVMSHVRNRPASLSTDIAARKAEVHLRLKHASWWKVPFLWIGALLGGLYRLFAGILFKDPGHGGRQFVATLAALLRPGAIIRGRSSANRTRRVSRSVIQSLQIDSRDVRSYRRSLFEALTGAGQSRDEDLLDSAGEYVPSGDANDDFVAIATSRRLWAGAGAVLVVIVLAAISVVSMFRFIGAEAISGGGLLPLSSALSDIWHNAVSWWIGLGGGWPGHGEPFDAVLGVLGVLGLGNGSAAVGWLILLALPLAGLGAWFCTGALIRSRWPRVLAAFVWAGAPMFLLALGQGRLGALIAHVIIPWVFFGFIRAMGAAQSRRGADPALTAALPTGKPGIAGRISWTAAAAAGLGLAVLTASAQSLLPLAIILVVLFMVFGGRRARTLWWTLLPTAALFVPFIISTLDRPRAILADPGVPLAFNIAPSWQQLLGQPLVIGSDAALPGMSWLPAGIPWAWLAVLIIGAPLVLLAVGALVWPNKRSATVRVLWLVGIFALVLGYLVGHIGTSTGKDALVTPFSGPALSVLAFALLGSATIALDAVQGWRSASVSGNPTKGRALPRTVAGILTVLLIISPIASLSMWVYQNLNGGTELQSSTVRSLPATATDRGLGPDRSRSLVIDANQDGSVDAALVRGAGTSMDSLSSIAAAQGISGLPGAEKISGDDPVNASIRAAVATIVAGTGVDPRPILTSLDVGFIVLHRGDTQAELLASQIDGVPGLATVGPTDQGWLWRVTPTLLSGAPAAETIARVRIDDGKGGTLSFVPSGLTSIDTTIAAGQQGRLLILAERADVGWTAWLNGRKLSSAAAPEIAGSWAQAFQLPAEGGQLEVRYEQPWAPLWAVVQIALLALTLLLAIPLPAGRSGVSRAAVSRAAVVQNANKRESAAQSATVQRSANQSSSKSRKGRRAFDGNEDDD